MMDKFPRGTLPPTPLSVVARRAPAKGARCPTTVSDLDSTCPNCGTLMQPEHAHYRCLTCGYRDSCCF